MQEIEAKFYVRDLKRIKTRLDKLDAHLVQERVLETNIRFDLPDARLRSQGRVLRLRQDTETHLTYKGAGTSEQGVIDRTEIEFVVGDFEKAKLFLEALGYQKLLQYDKYRTTYELANCHIMLDELPYGDFVEIEGSNITAIQAMANKINLDPQAAIAKSYSTLFDTARRRLGLTFTDLTFLNFKEIKVLPEHLQVRPADQPLVPKHD